MYRVLLRTLQYSRQWRDWAQGYYLFLAAEAQRQAAPGHAANSSKETGL